MERPNYAATKLKKIEVCLVSCSVCWNLSQKCIIEMIAPNLWCRYLSLCPHSRQSYFYIYIILRGSEESKKGAARKMS